MESVRSGFVLNSSRLQYFLQSNQFSTHKAHLQCLQQVTTKSSSLARSLTKANCKVCYERTEEKSNEAHWWEFIKYAEITSMIKIRIYLKKENREEKSEDF